MMRCNAQLMEQLFNDRRLTPIEKMKGFGIGVRNQTMMSRDMTNRMAKVARYAAKPGDIKALNYSPTDAAE